MAACLVSAHSIMDTTHFLATQFMGRETVIASSKKKLWFSGQWLIKKLDRKDSVQDVFLLAVFFLYFTILSTFTFRLLFTAEIHFHSPPFVSILNHFSPPVGQHNLTYVFYSAHCEFS